MVFEKDDVRQVTETVWDLTFQMNLSESAQQVPKAGAMAASVDIRGAWNGTVTLVLAAELARELAATMYDTAPADLPVADVQDAVGELTNMVGGNLRGLVPEECQLSLPHPVTETGLPMGPSDYSLGFACGGKTLWVLVHEGA